MATILNDAEARVLGSLIEKQITTPEYYPLTLNSLMLACNQKNNRYPVTSYNESTVADAIQSLRDKNLAYLFYGSNSRVPKYKHVAPENLEVNEPELALICVLMLRGAQTVGELRERASRLHSFAGLEEVEETLQNLMNRDPALVTRLPRQAGQKEVRFAHLLCGPVTTVQTEAETQHAAPTRRAHDSDRILRLEQQVEGLTAALNRLREEMESFRKQFE
jgi:uncharacterized protein